MTARVALLTASVVLLVAAPASAKEISGAAMCGADGCVDVTKKAAMTLLEGGPVAEPPTRAERSFFLRAEVREGKRVMDAFRMRWVPKAGLMRGEDGTWFHTTPAGQAQLERVSKGMRPLPISRTQREEARQQREFVRAEQRADARLEREVAAQASDEAEEDGDGGPGTMLAIGAPAGVGLVLASALLARRRRRRR